MASKAAAKKPARKSAAKAVAKPAVKASGRKATSKTARKSSVKVSAAPKAASAAATNGTAPEVSATLQEAVANVHASVQAVANGGTSTTATTGGGGEIGYADVAIASLCQSYAHTLSLAFHDIVLNQQRRSALGQAALARAIEQIQTAEPKHFEEKLGQLRKGLDVLGVSGSNDMEDFTAMSQQFVDAANQLVAVREKMAS